MTLFDLYKSVRYILDKSEGWLYCQYLECLEAFDIAT